MAQTLTILDMQTRNYKRIMERKALLEQRVKDGTPVIHHGDKYIITDVKLVNSHVFHKQLYFVGTLIPKND